jgi:pyruvate/2-oxoglutarate dehydrogenase complex dihydrolipoamide acyltransferase (E2) component
MSSLNEILLPSMGEGVTEATIVKWLKSVGEYVEKDSPLVEVSTDKVDTEVLASASGYLLKTYAEVADKVAVHQTIAYLSEDKSATAPETVAHVQKKTPSASATTQREKRVSRLERVEIGTISAATPLARKLAQHFGINVSALSGHGANGKVTRQDVEDFISLMADELKARILPEQGSARVNGLSQDEQGRELLEGVPVRRESMSAIRKLTAKHMLESVRVSPHVTTTFEVDMHSVYAYREKLKSAKKDPVPTMTHCISYVAVQCLKKFPLLNASVDQDDILYRDDINIGIAVAIETGLIVPVVKRCQSLDFSEFISKSNDLITRARQKTLQPDEIKGGSFSITNPGLYGSVHSSPLILQPQVAIMNVGAIVQRPVVVDNQITIRPMMFVGLTFDHRLVDGEGGAKFLAEFRHQIEKFI